MIPFENIRETHALNVDKMTDIFGSDNNKRNLKSQLFHIAVGTLEKAGWKVEREQGSGKSSVRRITKGGESKIVSIRTTQDTWIAFPRIKGDKSWRTLDEVDAVVPVSVDDRHNPKFAKVHMIDGDEMRDRTVISTARSRRPDGPENRALSDI